MIPYQTEQTLETPAMLGNGFPKDETQRVPPKCRSSSQSPTSFNPAHRAAVGAGRAATEEADVHF